MANGCPPPPAELNGRPVWAPEALAAQVAFYEETLGALGVVPTEVVNEKS